MYEKRTNQGANQKQDLKSTTNNLSEMKGNNDSKQIVKKRQKK